MPLGPPVPYVAPKPSPQQARRSAICTLAERIYMQELARYSGNAEKLARGAFACAKAFYAEKDKFIGEGS